MNTSKLSPVKKEIAELLISGLSKEKVVGIMAGRRKVSKKQRAYGTFKSYVTMVDNMIQNYNKKEVVKIKKDIVKSEKKLQDFTEGDAKNRVKVRLVEEMLHSSIKTGPVLTLSSHQCDTELRIQKELILKTLYFISCECDGATYSVLKDNVIKNKWNFMHDILNCKIGVILRIAGKDAFSHLLLDYCKTLKEHAEEIEIAIKNKLVVKGGLIWITVSSRKGGATKTELQNIIKRAGGSDYKIECEYSYRDTGPMVSMIVRRIK